MTIRILNFTLILTLLLSVACGEKKCQQPATEKFKTIVDQPWRLVETTDSAKSFQALSSTTFLVFDFTKDYKGSVKKVENNAEFENPLLVFKYNIDPEAKVIRALFTPPPTSAETAANLQEEEKPADPGTVVDYDYELGRELELYNSTNGAYYRFVPYKGIIAPDDTCTF